MRWSYRVGKLAGIDVYVHVTFLLLLVFMGASRLLSGHSLGEAILTVALVAMVFGIVVLHELGHALAARRFGIPTRDITLLPIGGVARLARLPQRPLQELAVAAAGPAVNLVLGSASALGLYLMSGLPLSLPVLLASEFVEWLVMANVVLLVFNLIPAFPMDGGRILRALLALRLPFLRATEIAVHVGRFMAVLLGLVGLFYNPMLVLIAFFVWSGGTTELAMVRHRYRPFPVWGPFSQGVSPEPFPGSAQGERVLLVQGPTGWQVVRIQVTPPPGDPPAQPETTVRIVDIK